jgi:hypothetical protein
MFRFTIRDALWLTALLAVSIGWWLENQSKRRQAADEQDTATILRADNAQLEHENSAHRAKSLRPQPGP